jgi:hypothetical protein
MENQNNLTLNDQAVDALRVSAKWCMFLAIVGFIGLGFLLLLAIFMYAAMSAVPEMAMAGAGAGMPGGMGAGFFGAMKGFLCGLYVVIAIVYFFPVYYLYKYAKGMKNALESSNSDMLTEALVNLKSHHKFLGIMTIVMISLYIVLFIGMMIFAASMASAAAGM